MDSPSFSPTAHNPIENNLESCPSPENWPTVCFGTTAVEVYTAECLGQILGSRHSTELRRVPLGE